MKNRAVFFWDHFADYHVDRCIAVREGGDFLAIRGIQVAGASDTYAWVTDVPEDLVHTLFEGGNADRVSKIRLFLRMAQACRDYEYVFVCNYDRLEIFLVALTVRLLGRKPIIMFDSKFDDKPRFSARELLKGFMLKVYSGALVSGIRSEQYLRFLGFSGPISQGYDTLSVTRIQKLSDNRPRLSPAITFVGRFVAKKNLESLIDSYEHYCSLNSNPLPLRLVGDGPLRSVIEGRSNQLSKGKIEITGFLDQLGVAQAVNSAAVLIQPSIEEQWGLVINEAAALGKPIITSLNVGANDSLLSVGRNGFTVHPHDTKGMAKLIEIVCHSDWRGDPAAAAQAQMLADVREFVGGVRAVVASINGRSPSGT